MVSFKLLEQMRDYSLEFLDEHNFVVDHLTASLSTDGESVFIYLDDFTFEYELSMSGNDFSLAKFTANYELPF